MMSSRDVGHSRQVRPGALEALAAISPDGPYRWPLLDGTLVYLSRRGEVEWRAPRAHPEQSPAAGVEWWWSVPLSEMVLRLAELGLELFAAEGHRLPELTTVRVPDGVDSAAVRKELLERYDLEIGGGVGAYAATVWRIGLMG